MRSFPAQEGPHTNLVGVPSLELYFVLGPTKNHDVSCVVSMATHVV